MDNNDCCKRAGVGVEPCSAANKNNFAFYIFGLAYTGNNYYLLRGLCNNALTTIKYDERF